MLLLDSQYDATKPCVSVYIIKIILVVRCSARIEIELISALQHKVVVLWSFLASCCEPGITYCQYQEFIA